MERVQKKIIIFLSVLMFFLTVFVPVPAYAADISLKPKKLTMYVGETRSLRLSASWNGKVQTADRRYCKIYEPVSGESRKGPSKTGYETDVCSVSSFCGDGKGESTVAYEAEWQYAI